MDEVNKCYSIKSYGIYKNKRVNVRKIKGNLIHIGTSNSQLARELELDRTDKYYYEKWVPIVEVQLFEEREEIKIK